MKREYRKFVLIICFSVFVVLIILLGLKFLNQKKYCSARLQRGIDVEEINAESLDYFTIWEEKRDASFSNPMLDISCTGECVYIVGEMDRLHKWKVIDGTLFLDDKGVIVTEALAHQLYHSVYVVGEKLRYEQKDYYVRGVVCGEQSKVYISAASPNEALNGYEWAESMENNNLKLTNISYTVDRKKCLFKKVPETLQFQLEKNGYPQIDMLLYSKK